MWQAVLLGVVSGIAAAFLCFIFHFCYYMCKPILILLERKSPKGMYKREPIASPIRKMDTNFNEKESYSRSSSNVKEDTNVSLYVRRAEVDKRYPCTKKASDTVIMYDFSDFVKGIELGR